MIYHDGRWVPPGATGGRRGPPGGRPGAARVSGIPMLLKLDVENYQKLSCWRNRAILLDFRKEILYKTTQNYDSPTHMLFLYDLEAAFRQHLVPGRPPAAPGRPPAAPGGPRRPPGGPRAAPGGPRADQKKVKKYAQALHSICSVFCYVF